MDVAYNQHADRARRKNRSSTSLNHLSLAPLTAKLPLNDDELIADAIASHPQSPIHPIPSYIQGKSAPTTPRLLARSPTTSRSRSHNRTPSAPTGSLSKSKSASHLAASGGRKTLSGRATPSKRNKDDHSGLSFTIRHRNDSDWLLRTGALMSSEARESKGQAWLISRQSSTSLTAMHDPEEEAFEFELARERDMTAAASRHASRRGSNAHTDEDASPYASRFPSRSHSRSHSLARPRSQLLSPLDRPGTGDESYFPQQDAQDDLPGPDFVNLDERLEELERDTTQDDEAAVRRLVRRGQAGAGTWFGNVWSLFSVEEDDEDSEDDSEDSPTDGDSQLNRSRSWSSRHLAGISTAPEERMPPPGTDDGGWRDAAWLLSVASKVMF
ncbi:hypothetical protein FALBO_1849 [Fusarium albosuccineum]|uniref:Uncharacterized protein n=1 Tax=Fusarium albosuccineum TaxID=1237068 RepID=A0A8H4LL64_9HYPO|nr:hypothetical protein FALBO_1849 [Fusarium albosuccineum]KAF5008296.1 hypothetical protein FDECE_5434 [Fusarium decemcellulare]